MKINDQIANDTVVIINDKSVLFVSYDSTLNSLSGEVNVEVTARANSINLLRKRQLLVGTGKWKECV